MILAQLTLGGASILVLIGLLVAFCKNFGVQGRLLPLISIIFGIILGVIIHFTGDVTLINGIIGGLLAGASVSGLYDIGKKTVLGK